jgi:hypothetical protein
VGAQLVARIGGLGGVDAGAVRELGDQRDHQRQPHKRDQQGHAALAVPGLFCDCGLHDGAGR